MRQKVVALSRCLDHTSTYGRFHFKGVYLGHYIVEINLCMKDNVSAFETGGDYLLYLDVVDIISNRLMGKLISYKRV
jgi:hypothetical protein